MSGDIPTNTYKKCVTSDILNMIFRFGAQGLFSLDYCADGEIITMYSLCKQLQGGTIILQASLAVLRGTLMERIHTP